MKQLVLGSHSIGEAIPMTDAIQAMLIIGDRQAPMTGTDQMPRNSATPCNLGPMPSWTVGPQVTMLQGKIAVGSSGLQIHSVTAMDSTAGVSCTDAGRLFHPGPRCGQQ